jgi:hypothetical protein
VRLLYLQEAPTKTSKVEPAAILSTTLSTPKSTPTNVDSSNSVRTATTDKSYSTQQNLVQHFIGDNEPHYFIAPGKLIVMVQQSTISNGNK